MERKLSIKRTWYVLCIFMRRTHLVFCEHISITLSIEMWPFICALILRLMLLFTNRKVGIKHRKPPKVIAVIPAYLKNEETIIEETLNYIERLKCVSRIYLVWNGPQPSDSDLLTRLQNRKTKVVYVETSRSKADNLNYIIKTTQADFYAFFDADSRPHPNMISESLERFVSPQIGWVQSSFNVMYSGSFLSYVIDILDLNAVQTIFSIVSLFIGSSIYIGHDAVFRSQVFKHCGYFDPLKMSEDIDYSFKCIRHSYKGIWIENKLSSCSSPPSFSALILQKARWYGAAHESILINLIPLIVIIWFVFPKLILVFIWLRLMFLSPRQVYLAPLIPIHLAMMTIAVPLSFKRYLNHQKGWVPTPRR